jgi:hypothetical protein
MQIGREVGEKKFDQGILQSIKNKIPYEYFDFTFVDIDNIDKKKIAQLNLEEEESIPLFLDALTKPLREVKFQTGKNLTNICNKIASFVPVIKHI